VNVRGQNAEVVEVSIHGSSGQCTGLAGLDRRRVLWVEHSWRLDNQH